MPNFIGDAWVRIRGKDDGSLENDTESAFSGAAKKAAVAIGGAFAAAQVGGFLKDAVAGASDLGESMSKNQTIFGDSFGAIEKFASGADKAMGQSKAQALAATGVFGNLIRSLGVGAPEASAMSMQMVQLASDLASFNNTSVDEALEALRAGITGEAEPLKKFGINMNDATLKAQALKMGLIASEKEGLTPQTKALAAQALIMAQTTLAQGDFARTSGGLANQQRILAAQVENLKARIGAALLPALTEVALFANEKLIPAISAMGEWLGPRLKAVIDAVPPIFQRVVAAIRPVVEEWLPRIRTAIGFVVDHWQLFAAGALAVVSPLAAVVAGLVVAWQRSETFREVVRALADFLVNDAAPAVAEFASWVVDQIGQLADWWREHWDSIREAVGHVLVVIETVIRTTISVLTALWRAFGDEILDAARIAWNLISGIVSAAMEVIRGIIDVVLGLINGNWSQVWEGIRQIVDGIWRAIGTIVSTAIDGIRLGIEAFLSGLRLLWDTAWAGIREIAKAAFDAVVGFVEALPGRVLSFLGSLSSAAKDLGNGILNGIVDIAATIASKVGDEIGKIPGKIRDGVGAVKTAAGEIGSAILSGIGDALGAAWDVATSIVGDIASGLKGAINGILDKLEGWINEGLDAADKAAGPFINFGSIHLPRFHGGGVAGTEGTSWGAASGLRSGEIAAILQRGEVVFTPGQLNALGSALSGLSAGSPMRSQAPLVVQVMIDRVDTAEAATAGEMIGNVAARTLLARRLAVEVR